MSDPRTKEEICKEFERDLDFWSNGKRKLFHHVTPSLIAFLEREAPSVVEDSVRWCDLGCGGGYFLDGLIESASRRGIIVYPSGVDISPVAIAACKNNWPDFRFEVCDLDTYQSGGDVPWRRADVVSMVEVFYYLLDYRRTFNQVFEDLSPGTVIVVSDANIRYHRRVYPKSLPQCAFLGSWTDNTVPVVDATDGHSRKFIKYAVYRKLL